MEFKKYFKIKAPVQDVYNAIVNPDMIELWTGEEAFMDDQAGTEFSLYGGNIVGKNILVEKEKKIIQHWYFGDENNPSEVTMIFHAEKTKTSVEIRQTNIPEDAFENISEGWSYAYFEPIRELLEE